METSWLLWQLVDSAFPTGGFAHSSGLEAAWQSGEVPDRDSFRQFLRDSIQQAGRGALPLMTAAHRAPARVGELDRFTDAYLTNAVANRASRVQGRALVSTCARVWPQLSTSALDAQARGAYGHYAPYAGAVWRALELPLDVVQHLFLFQAARGVIAAAVRLGIVGSYEAQRLHVEAKPVLDEIAAACAELDDRHLAQTAPILDILQASHDRLYSRLFQS